MATIEKPLIGPQSRSLEALRELLDATGADYRLDRNQPDEAVFELRINGMGWGFVEIGYDGALTLL